LALHDDTPARFRAYGWNVIEVGEAANDLNILEAALRSASNQSERPTLIVLRSHIGFPSPSMLDRREAHGSPFKADAISEVKAILGLSDDRFVVDDELALRNRNSIAGHHDSWSERVAAAGERGLALLQHLRDGGALLGDASAERYEAGTEVATRKAMQRAMDAFGSSTTGITAGSADLTDNTGVLLSFTAAQSASNPGGRQIYYGIREFAMGAVVVGQSLHGGVRPIASTFFVFSDYMRPALRLAALSETPSLFVFTHDSVGVGEDGPTHQPVEHLMALRTIPGLHVVRPSDANETLEFVEGFLRDVAPPPTALILTRQDIKVLSGEAAEASKSFARRGGYVARESDRAQFTLMATGSEVAVCLQAADELAAQGISARVVALPCWACFETQDESYRGAVLRYDLPSVSLEAGTTLGWHKYADDAIGIDRFGLSAPGPFVYEHLGMTAQNLVSHVLDRLDQQ